MSDVHEEPSDPDGGDLPEETIDEAERLTRLARNAVDDGEQAAYRERREQLLADHEFTARVREAGGNDTLVLHPDAWLNTDGVVRTDRIEDLSRAVEIPLEGAGDPDDWATLDAQNRELVTAVRSEHGDVHGDNVEALADFMGNHYARPIDSVSQDELAEFLSEYFVRNAWPSDEQRAVIEESIELLFKTVDREVPEFSVEDVQ
ncbi:DUF7108 family protein [Natronobeatus ordinarius]|uniref:DUF7108 family protein n=1 Tax=Natronobeatus ordinarius TaxID=2963433 RepID=UPI0020CF1BA7|nr:rnhA operon protein [Natronobeatus ordinarius]